MRLAAGAAAGTAASEVETHDGAPAAPHDGATSEIARLDALHASGALTDAELSAATSRLLGT